MLQAVGRPKYPHEAERGSTHCGRSSQTWVVFLKWSLGVAGGWEVVGERRGGGPTQDSWGSAGGGQEQLEVGGESRAVVGSLRLEVIGDAHKDAAWDAGAWGVCSPSGSSARLGCRAEGTTGRSTGCPQAHPVPSVWFLPPPPGRRSGPSSWGTWVAPRATAWAAQPGQGLRSRSASCSEELRWADPKSSNPPQSGLLLEKGTARGQAGAQG